MTPNKEFHQQFRDRLDMATRGLRTRPMEAYRSANEIWSLYPAISLSEVCQELGELLGPDFARGFSYWSGRTSPKYRKPQS